VISLLFIEFIEPLVDMALKLFSPFPFSSISLTQGFVCTSNAGNCSCTFFACAPLADSLSRGQSADGTEDDTTENDQVNHGKISHN
jgi:hypothetical protein